MLLKATILNIFIKSFMKLSTKIEKQIVNLWCKKYSEDFIFYIFKMNISLYFAHK